MADGLMAGSILSTLPIVVLFARDRVADHRALRSDLPEPALARLPANGVAPQRSLRMVACVFLCVSDDDGRRASAQVHRRSQREDLCTPAFIRAPLHHRTRRTAIF